MQVCLFCGGDASGPNHRLYCDGRQGVIEDEYDDALEAEPPEIPIVGMVRREDHATSVEAAVAVAVHVSDLQGRVLEAFRQVGPMTDERLERLERFARYAYSTLRKRRTELYHLGKLVAVGSEINSRGRRMLVWALAGGN